MMKKFSLLLILALVMSFQSTVVATCFQGANQKKATEEDLIRQTLTDYIEGSTNGQPKRLQKAFHLNLNLYSTKNGKLSIWPGTDYIKDTKEGKPTGETGKILSIDFENDAAVAKVEIAHPRSPTPYIDYFMLLKLEGKWTIIHKMFTKKTSKPNAEKASPKTETPDAGSKTKVNSDLSSDIDVAVHATMKEIGLPGAGVVIVKDGKTILKRGYGIANLESNVTVDPDKTLFRIGSISKALTLLTLTRQIDKGLVKMDDDVAKYFDGIRNPYGFKKPVTIKNLLTHTSGFDQIGGRDRQIRNFDQPLAQRKAARPNLSKYLQNDKLRRVSPAGEFYRYDTYGSTLAGAVLERVTGKSYAEAIKTEMFDELGMASTFVEAATPRMSDLAIGYETENGTARPQPYEIYVTTPASSIDSTVADMGRLLEALTGDGANEHGRLYGRETAKAVLSAQFRPHPEFLGTSHGLHESYQATKDSKIGVRIVDHGGTMLGYRSLMAILPEQNVGVFVVTNHSGGGRNPLAAAVMNAVVDNVPNLQGRELYPVPARDKGKDLNEYVGDFYYGVFCHAPTKKDHIAGGVWSRPSPRSVMAVEGCLEIADNEYLPRGDDVFVRTDGEQMVYFGRDEAGEISFFSYSTSADTFEKENKQRPLVQIQSLAASVLEVATNEGANAAIEHFNKHKDLDDYYLIEAEMNNAGYALMQAKKANEAIEIFKLNAGAFPDSWNVFDSLGEAYAANGETTLAIKNYQRSIKINPRNAEGQKILKELMSK